MSGGRGVTCTPGRPRGTEPEGGGDRGAALVVPFAKRRSRVCRRNRAGDREKALAVLLPVVEHGEGAAPDLLCLCGRIYKDMFIDSGFTDTEMRDQAFYW